MSEYYSGYGQDTYPITDTVQGSWQPEVQQQRPQLPLQQPFDWPPFNAAPPPSAPPLPLPYPSQVNGGLAGLIPPQQLPIQRFPKGGAIHLAAGMPDEMLPKHFGTGSELVKVTGKSCASCRTRKVKCDRRFPECSRCVKRKEPCEYGEDISLALRPIVVLNHQQKGDSPTSNDSSPRTANFPSHPPIPPHNRLPSSSLGLPYPPRAPLEASPARSLRTVSDFRHQLARRIGNEGAEQEERRDQTEGFQQLWDRFLIQSNLGESSSDWRLALPTMASSLTLHLLEASMNSCCYHLPAFHILDPNIAYYKQNLNNLDVASQVAVGVLTSLGARASPHSALLGVAGPDIENGKASHELVLSAGVRRENAWRAIVKQATELCSKVEVMQVASVINAQTLVAFVQMLMLSEVKPKTARYFLRAAIGLFYDMQRGGLPQHEVDLIKQSVGVTLFESDARIGAWLSLPVLISEDDLFDYFEGTGVHLVNLEQEDLGDQLAALFNPSKGPMTTEKTEQALKITGFYVIAVQRLFSKISSSRRASNQFLTNIQQLWDYIDGAHSACQTLTGHLRAFAMAQDDVHHPANHDLLIGLRMHERLLDVMNLSNEWLRTKRNDRLTNEDRNALESLLGVSNRRVRRCLKVLAFYAKVFHDSHDKHVVYHLFTQLEAVEGWATMAVQREGEVDEFGPIAQQCVLTETELDYFAQALELACFYTPLSAQRLDEFSRARRMRGPPPNRFVPLADFDIAVPTPTDSARSSISPPNQSPTQSRFIDIQVNEGTEQTSTPLPISVPASQPFLTGNSHTVQSSNSSSLSNDPLSGWVLSGFADNSSSNVTPASTNSPSNSSSGLSPGLLEESTDLASSFTGQLPHDAYSNLPPSFVSPLPTTFDQAMSFAPPPALLHGQNNQDLSFPSSHLSNLAHLSTPAYDFPRFNIYNGNGDTAESRREPPSPQRDYSAQTLRTGGNGNDGQQWSNYTTWQGNSLQSPM